MVRRYTILTNKPVVRRESTPLYSPLAHAPVMADFANAINSNAKGHAKTDERRARIVISYLMDLQRFMGISYCVALFDLSDVDANRMSNLQIWRKFTTYGTFFVGSWSREEFCAVSHRVKKSPVPMAGRSV